MAASSSDLDRFTHEALDAAFGLAGALRVGTPAARLRAGAELVFLRRAAAALAWAEGADGAQLDTGAPRPPGIVSGNADAALVDVLAALWMRDYSQAARCLACLDAAVESLPT